jgi:hypothetical protein
MHEERAGALRLLAEDARRDAVHRVGRSRSRLGAIDVVYAAALRMTCGRALRTARRIASSAARSERRVIVRNHLGATGERPDEVRAHLAPAPGDERANHGKVSACASGSPAASLGLRSGVAS